jgi:hypothetical protein
MPKGYLPVDDLSRIGLSQGMAVVLALFGQLSRHIVLADTRDAAKRSD